MMLWQKKDSAKLHGGRRGSLVTMVMVADVEWRVKQTHVERGLMCQVFHETASRAGHRWPLLVQLDLGELDFQRRTSESAMMQEGHFAQKSYSRPQKRWAERGDLRLRKDRTRAL